MVREIPLTQGKVALIDDDDYERVAVQKWYAVCTVDGKWYALRGVDHRGLYLHRFILDARPGEFVDHRDDDGLNCQRFNLRSCDNTRNQYNQRRHRDSTTGFKGVSYGYKKWYSRISVSGQRIYLGVFDSAEDAARAYDAEARRHHGEFARVNFPQDGEQAA